jgi:dTDP-4-dehydrorhamnose reductase
MKILVFGAGGMLGRDLTCHLEDCCHDVVGLDSSACDITSLNDCQRAIDKYSPDIAVNAAAYTNVDGCEGDRERCFRVNGEGVKNIALACQGRGALVVHFSTDYVFDGAGRNPCREDDFTVPINAYGASKLEGERLLAEFADSWLLIRTSWLYGIHGKNFVKAILDKAASADHLEVVNDQVGSPTFTGDLSWATGLLIEKRKTGIYHLTNRGQCSWHEFACKILEYTGRSSIPVKAISSSDLKRAAIRPAWSVLSTEKFTRDTGETMREWEEALKDYLKESSGTR